MTRHMIFGSGRLNDLWRFNISSNEWTWLSGNNTVNAFGNYGTKGAPSVDNYPGARRGHSMAFDFTLGCIYIFGGLGYHRGGSLCMSIFLSISHFCVSLFE
jgi:hypothetical protein